MLYLFRVIMILFLTNFDQPEKIDTLAGGNPAFALMHSECVLLPLPANTCLVLGCQPHPLDSRLRGNDGGAISYEGCLSIAMYSGDLPLISDSFTNSFLFKVQSSPTMATSKGFSIK